MQLQVSIVRECSEMSVCDSSINETNICDNNHDTNIEYVETSQQFKNVCFYCDKDRKQNNSKQQNLHSSKDAKLYQKIIEWMEKFNNDVLLQKIIYLKSVNRSIFYHHLCKLYYLNEYNKVVSDIPCTSWHKNRHSHKEIFNQIISTIEQEVKKKELCIAIIFVICTIMNWCMSRNFSLRQI